MAGLFSTSYFSISKDGNLLVRRLNAHCHDLNFCCGIRSKCSRAKPEPSSCFCRQWRLNHALTRIVGYRETTVRAAIISYQFIFMTSAIRE